MSGGFPVKLGNIASGALMLHAAADDDTMSNRSNESLSLQKSCPDELNQTRNKGISKSSLLEIAFEGRSLSSESTKTTGINVSAAGCSSKMSCSLSLAQKDRLLLSSSSSSTHTNDESWMCESKAVQGRCQDLSFLGAASNSISFDSISTTSIAAKQTQKFETGLTKGNNFSDVAHHSSGHSPNSNVTDGPQHLRYNLEERGLTADGHQHNHRPISHSTDIWRPNAYSRKERLTKDMRETEFPKKTRTWKSESNLSIPLDPRKKAHGDLTPVISSMLDASVEVDQDSMTWRKGQLQSYQEAMDAAVASQLDVTTDDFMHPLQVAIPRYERRRSLSHDIDDDVSVMTTNSTMSSWSASSIYQSWFATGDRRRQSSQLGVSSSSIHVGQQSDSVRTGRRFIDLTNGGQEDYGDEYGGDKVASSGKDSDDISTSMYSIPNPKRKPDERRPSDARQFIDLTEVHDEILDESRRQLFTRMASWMGHVSFGSASGESAKTGFDPSTKSDLQGLSMSDSGEEVCDLSDDEDSIELSPWEKADAALVEHVHSVATNLDRLMNERGFDSPFWSAKRVLPPFSELHSKIEDNLARVSKTENASHPEAQQESKSAEDTNKTVTKNRRRTLEDRFSSCERKRNALPAQDMSGGYDDLGMRTLYRDDRAYLKHFMYDYRRDGTCSLPVVLVGGLEKHLSDKTINEALDILEDITSPIRPRRRHALDCLQEDPDEL